MNYQGNLILKIPDYFIRTKFCIVLNSVLNMRSTKVVHATLNTLSEKNEVVSMNFFELDSFLVFHADKKLSADEENWHFQTRVTLIVIESKY